MAWDRTKILEVRLEDLIKGDTYLGRPIIKRDTPIDGGVYLGGSEREAIVVNSQKAPYLNYAYLVAQEKALHKGKIRKTLIPGATYLIVQELLSFDSSGVDEIIKDCKNDQKISLGAFLQEGKGVCRHMALLAAFILEKFQKEGHLNGKVSVDRNSLYPGAHAWCRYTNSAGKVFILDAAQKYFGTLEDSPKHATWHYFRDSDLK